MFHMGMAVSSMERNRQKSPIDLEQYINSKIAHLIGATWYLIWNFILLIKSAFPKFWMLYPTQHFHISLFLCWWGVIECCLAASYCNVATFLQTTDAPQYNPHHQLSQRGGNEIFRFFGNLILLWARGGEVPIRIKIFSVPLWHDNIYN